MIEKELTATDRVTFSECQIIEGLLQGEMY